MPDQRPTAIYCRISRDRDGTLLGVERQEAACRKLIEEHGWPLVGVYTDNDVSAFAGKRRPEYERLVDDVKNGLVGRVVALHPDRLHRSLKELEAFVDLINVTDVQVETVNAGKVDLTTRSGRTHARIVGVVARDESEAKSERLKAKHDELATRGRWKGGPRPYGYRPVGDGQLQVVPEEAAVIKEMAARVLGGESVYSLTNDLNARQVPTSNPGKLWRTQTIRRVLTAPGTAGLRDHHGEVIGEGCWEPILDREQHEQLNALILDPSRARGRVRRSYLLTGGLARCGRCGTALKAQRRGSGARAYGCLKGSDWDGCGQLYVAADPLEAIVVETVLQRLDTPRLASARAKAPKTKAGEIETLERRRDALAAMLARGDMTEREWATARKVIESALVEARARVQGTVTDAALRPYARAGSLRSAWPDLPIDRQAAIVAAVIEKVTIAPATRRGPIFDPDRIGITWRA